MQDGLVDAYDKNAMGVCADACAEEYGLAEASAAVQSYQRSANAWKEGNFKDEVVPIAVPQRKGDPIVVTEDEEFKNVRLDKF